MDTLRTLRSQATRAAGASLLAPLILLLVGGALAAGGNSASLSSLGQLTSGPDLPDTGLPIAGAPVEDAEIVGADTAGLTAIAAAGLPAPELGTITPDGRVGGPPPSTGRDEGPPIVVGTPIPRSPEANVPPEPDVPPAPQAPAAPPAPDPVGQGIDDTRGIGESLPGPLGPVTKDILDLLLPR